MGKKKWSGDRLTAKEEARKAEVRAKIQPGKPLPRESTQPVKDGVLRTGGGLIG